MSLRSAWLIWISAISWLWRAPSTPDALLIHHRNVRDLGTWMVLVGVILEIFVDEFWEISHPPLLRGIKATKLLRTKNSLLKRYLMLFIVIGMVGGGIALEYWQGSKADNVADTIRNHLTASLEVETKKARTAEEKLSERAWLLGNILLPRRLPISIGPHGPTGREFATLTTFAKTKLLILSAPDLESVQLAGDISAALREAGWNEGDPTGSVTILSVKQGYSLVGVHVTAELSHPEVASPLMNAAWTLNEYLSTGYIDDWASLGDTFAPNIDSEYEPIIPNRPLPEWWPNGIAVPSDTVCLLVGRKDFKQVVELRHALDEMPEKLRKWYFSRHAYPWVD